MRRLTVIAVGLALAGCAPLAPLRDAPMLATAAPAPSRSPEEAARGFVAVVDDVEPVAEAFCRVNRPDADCDIQIAIDSRRRAPPNAFQTLDRRGRPIVGFTLALIAESRNDDEIAFVLSHEAAHHIAGHVPRSRESAARGAIMAGILAAEQGASPREIREAQEFGAAMVSRSYSQEFELEADALGAQIAFSAGYDPLRGSAFFDRLQDPADPFLSTHPPNAERKALVRATVAQMR